MRIDKVLSNLQYGSRKEIKQYIKDGEVTINGEVVTSPKEHVNPEKDTITFFGETIFYQSSIILMMNKPMHTVCANHDQQYPTVFTELDEKYKRLDLNSVGRLDLDTTGLLLLTNDGQLLHQIISPKQDIYKVYEATIDRPFDDVSVLASKYTLYDQRDRPYTPNNVRVKPISSHVVEIAIHEGKHHQIKDMVAYFDRNVTALKRTQIGRLRLDKNLSPGEVRPLTKEERKSLFN
ncbi:MAG: pseudouridine synthase [Candidatus Izemoplasma sp.]|nr:pseudouridine synthase [Candidatus Izemoplasma sp.]